MSSDESRHFRDTLAYIRDKLDDHIKEQNEYERKVLDRISEIKEESSVNKSKIVGISGVISVVVAAAITWMLNHLK